MDASPPVARVVAVDTPGLGDRSYLAHDGRVAVVVDPQRDIDRMLALAEAEGVRITHVAETHIHNDYVTGGLALARATGAAYLVGGADHVDFDRVPAREGTSFEVGHLRLEAIETPGHTPGHLAWALGPPAGAAEAVFTGGSLLYGTVGRTDLIAPERTDELTRAQYRSVRRLAGRLPASALVYPTHGFGSFCAATTVEGATVAGSTVGQERSCNAALLAGDEDAFVRGLVAGLTAHPAYYAHMAPANRRGPAAPDLSPPARVDPDELARRILAGEWVVDLRARRAFAAGHLPGSISVELGPSFATFLGWTIPWGTPLTLIGEDPDQVADAQRELVRIGIDRPAGAALAREVLGGEVLGGAAPLADYPVARFADLARAIEAPGEIRAPGDFGAPAVLDVRRSDEWDAGHLDGATHIPLWEVEQRLGEVPPGWVWVHCAGGMRASIAASLLARAGRSVVLVDDDWAQAGEVLPGPPA